VAEAEVDALIHRLKHMNPRAPQQKVHFGEVPIASVFDLRGFNLNAKLDIDPEFLNADSGHDHDHHDHDHEHGEHCDHPHHHRHDDDVKSFVFRSPRPSVRPSSRTSWAPSCRSTAPRCCATRACCT
jgi:G3E family GTPase